MELSEGYFMLGDSNKEKKNQNTIASLSLFIVATKGITKMPPRKIFFS